jgi:hypothetical protein
MIPANVQHGKYCPELAVTLCRASLDAYAGPEYTTALCHQWQAADAKLITAGDTEALLLIYPDCAILAFRGTSSGADVKTDLSATRAVWKGCSVHSGFLGAWQSIRPEVVAALQGHLLHGQPLYVTGHSLGGALATICAVDFGSGRYAGRTHLYTYGSPRVGDWRFTNLCNTRLGDCAWRIVHSNDGFARVPKLFRTRILLPEWCPLLPTARRYRHVSNLVFLTEDRHTLIRPSANRVLLERVVGFRFDIGRDHLCAQYLEALL